MKRLMWRMGMIVADNCMPCRMRIKDMVWYEYLVQQIMEMPFKGSTVGAILESYKGKDDD